MAVGVRTVGGGREEVAVSSVSVVVGARGQGGVSRDTHT